MAQFSAVIEKAMCLVNNRHNMTHVNKSWFLSSSESTKSYKDKFWPHKDEANIINNLLQWNLNLFKLNS